MAASETELDSSQQVRVAIAICLHFKLNDFVLLAVQCVSGFTLTTSTASWDLF